MKDRSNKVVKIKHSGNVKKDVETLIQKLGGIEKFIDKDDKVLIKPSCNSPDDFPAVTDTKVIEKIVQLVKQKTNKITIGDSSGVLHKPTKKVFDYMNLPKIANKEDVKLMDFDQYEWVEKQNKKAEYLTSVKITEKLDEFDKMIFLPTIRTHRGPGFTMSLKVGMGLIKTEDRMQKMHTGHLHESIADMNLYFEPDLILMDGRKCFITNGPESGVEKKPNVLFASKDRVAIDVEGLKILKKYKAKNLDMPIEEQRVIKHALKLGL